MIKVNDCVVIRGLPKPHKVASVFEIEGSEFCTLLGDDNEFTTVVANMVEPFVSKDEKLVKLLYGTLQEWVNSDTMAYLPNWDNLDSQIRVGILHDLLIHMETKENG